MEACLSHELEGRLGHSFQQRDQDVGAVVGFEREDLMIHQVTDRQQYLAFRPADGDRRAHQILKSCLQRILASYVPVRIVVSHEGSYDIAHAEKVN